MPFVLGGALSGPDSSSASLSDSEEDEPEELEFLPFLTVGASSIETSDSDSDSDSELESSLESDDSSLSSSFEEAEEDFHVSYMLTNEGAPSLLVPEITLPLRSFSSLIKALLAEA